MAKRRASKVAADPVVQVGLFSLVVIGVVWAVLLYGAVSARAHKMDDAKQHSSALARVLEANVSAHIEGARLLLDRAAVLARATDPAQALTGRAFRNALAAAAQDVRAVGGIALIGADGVVRVGALRRDGRMIPGEAALDVSDRDYFQALTSGAAGLVIGTPVRSRVDGRWLLPIARPIASGTAGFAGGVLAVIYLDAFTDLFSETLGEGRGRVAILRRDGVVLSAAPFDEAIVGGRSVPWAGVAEADPAAPRQAAYLTSSATAPETGITVMVGRNVNDVLRSWREEITFSVITGVVITILLGTLALAMAAQWMRRKQADKALAQSRAALGDNVERFERAIAGSTSALWEFDLRSQSGYFAPQWDELFGWGQVSNPYEHWLTALHPDDSDRVLTLLDAHLSQGVPFDTEYRLRAADGTWRWVKARGQAAWDGEGRPTVMSGSVHDITDLKHGEERLRLALDAANEGLWDWNVATGHLYMSERWHAILGRREEAIVPHWRVVLRLMHPEDRSQLLGWARRCLPSDGEDTHEADLRLRHADGSYVWTRLSAKVTERDHTGRALRVVGAIRDVTERIRELRQIREAKEQAELANRAKSEFLANTSHELRTPLNAICGFSEVLHSGIFGPLSGKQAEYVGHIRDSAEQLTSLINDILDMAKIESGRDELRPEPVDVAAAVRAKVQMVLHRAEAKGVELIEDVEPLPPYLLDARKFGQMLLNLLSNAVKFTVSGGTVTIRTSMDPDGGLRVAVIDTGIGIPPEEIQRVLEPFTQVDSGLARQFEGSGLGLTLVSAMVRMHGGTFDLSSRVGEGTVATICFPASRRLAMERETEAPV